VPSAHGGWRSQRQTRSECEKKIRAKPLGFGARPRTKKVNPSLSFIITQPLGSPPTVFASPVVRPSSRFRLPPSIASISAFGQSNTRICARSLRERAADYRGNETLDDKSRRRSANNTATALRDPTTKSVVASWQIRWRYRCN